MRKNGSRLISLRQYRLTDLFLFALILIVFDLLAHFAPIMFPGGALYTFSLTIPMTLLVMMRWGWPAVFFAVGDGILQSALNNTYVWQSYVCYAIGNAFIMLLLLAFKFWDKRKIAKKWQFSVLFVVSGWVIMCFAVTAMQAICGTPFVSALALNFGLGTNGALSLAVAIVVILIMRRLDGMFEDQKQYLKRLDDERKEKMKIDEFGESPIEIDEETILALRKTDENLD